MRKGTNAGGKFPVLPGSDEIINSSTLSKQIRRIAQAGFNHVELSANFFSFNPQIYSPEGVDELERLQDELGLTYSMHMHNGYGVDLDSFEERTRAAAVATSLALMEAVGPLRIRHFVVHPVWGYVAAAQIAKSTLPENGKVRALSKLADQSAKSIREITNHVDSRDICLENLFLDFRWVEPLVEQLNTSICFDGGHWQLMGGDAPEFVKRYGSRIQIVHCHDVRNGKDHQPLRMPLAISWGAAMEELRKLDFQGPVVLEFPENSVENAISSMTVLEKLTAS